MKRIYVPEADNAAYRGTLLFFEARRNAAALNVVCRNRGAALIQGFHINVQSTKSCNLVQTIPKAAYQDSFRLQRAIPPPPRPNACNFYLSFSIFSTCAILTQGSRVGIRKGLTNDVMGEASFCFGANGTKGTIPHRDIGTTLDKREKNSHVNAQGVFQIRKGRK